MQKDNNIILQTDRLVLRGVKKEDLEAIQEYAVDPEVVKYMPWGPNTRQDTLDFIHKVLASRKEQPRTAYDFVLINKEEDHLIGACGLYIRDLENKEGSMGYVLNRRYWNRGFMTETAKGLLAFGFDQLGLHRIFATCDPANTGSYRVMEKSGMRREGYLRGKMRLKGIWRDFLQYSILESEWRERKNGASTAMMPGLAKKVEYWQSGPEDLDLIRPLWEKLIEHHKDVSRYHKAHYATVTFKARNKQLLEKSRDGALLVDLVRDLVSGEFIGYCVTSINAGKQGEIESLFVEEDFRGAGIGDSLMKRAVKWLASRNAAENTLRVAEGNEAVFSFYRRYNFYPRTTILQQREIKYPEN